jgi:hypothetical protein
MILNNKNKKLNKTKKLINSETMSLLQNSNKELKIGVRVFL